MWRSKTWAPTSNQQSRRSNPEKAQLHRWKWTLRTARKSGKKVLRRRKSGRTEAQLCGTYDYNSRLLLVQCDEDESELNSRSSVTRALIFLV